MPLVGAGQIVPFGNFIGWIMSTVSKFILLFMVQIVVTSPFYLSQPLDDNTSWSQFRGPNGSGVAQTDALPTEFGKDKNLLWMAPLLVIVRFGAGTFSLDKLLKIP